MNKETKEIILAMDAKEFTECIKYLSDKDIKAGDEVKFAGKELNLIFNIT